MKRIKICPTCGKPTDWCVVGHSLCFECGWNCEIKDCKSQEDRIKRFIDDIKMAIEDGDIRYIFDVKWAIDRLMAKITS